jgi:hypothetical protein
MTHPLANTEHGRYESREDNNGFHIHHPSRIWLVTLDRSCRPIAAIAGGELRRSPFHSVLAAGYWAESRIK